MTNTQSLMSTNPALAFQLAFGTAPPCFERDMLDISLSAERAPEGYQYLTWEQLKELLVVEDTEKPNWLNACLQIQDSPQYQALPEEERIRALRTAKNAMDWIQAGANSDK